MAFLLLGDRSLAEDLAQTVLVKVYLRWDHINDKSSAAGYAHTVMTRQAIRWRRRHWTRERSTDPILLPDSGAVADDDGVARTETVRRALMSLPASQRAVLVLRYFGQHTESEIAQMLRVSSGTVKSRAARALEALRATGLDIDIEPHEVRPT